MEIVVNILKVGLLVEILELRWELEETTSRKIEEQVQRILLLAPSKNALFNWKYSENWYSKHIILEKYRRWKVQLFLD